MNGMIIVVNFEQEREIGAFLDRLVAANPGLDVVVVDDGSADRSASIAEGRGFPVLKHGKNLGVGAAIRTGIRHAISTGRFEYLVIMSANGKMHPEELPLVIGPIVNGEADYVQGSRFLEGGRALSLSPFRRAAIPAYSLLATLLLRARFTDITCGFRAYRLSLFADERVNLDQDWLNRYEAELYIHYYACKLGARVIEVPVTIDYSHLEDDRKSKMRPFAGWWSLFRPLFLLSAGIKR
jgi:dolichol-phosphate mannosyltransferase